MSKTHDPRTITFTNSDDLAYLEALVDTAPTLSSRADMVDPLPDWWRQVLKHLIATARQAATEREHREQVGP